MAVSACSVLSGTCNGHYDFEVKSSLTSLIDCVSIDIVHNCMYTIQYMNGVYVHTHLAVWLCDSFV